MTKVRSFRPQLYRNIDLRSLYFLPRHPLRLRHGTCFESHVPRRRLRSRPSVSLFSPTGTATRIECHLCLREPVVQPSFVRLANRLAPSQAPLHALRPIQIGALPSCARSGCPLVPRSPPGSVTPRQLHHTAPDTGAERYAHRELSVPPSGRHSRLRLTAAPSMPTALPHSHLTMRFAIHNRCAVFNPPGARRVPR